MNQKPRTSDKSLTPGPTKEGRNHKADLPGAKEVNRTVDSQKKAVPSSDRKGK